MIEHSTAVDDRKVNQLVNILDHEIEDVAWLLRAENRGLKLKTARAIAQTAMISRILRAAQGDRQSDVHPAAGMGAG